MNKLAYLLLPAVLFTTTANVYAEDSKINWYQVSANTLLVADWLQTRNITDDPAYSESNNMLGAYPTTNEVDRYFITSIVLVNVVGSYVLPDKYSDVFYLTVATIQGRQVLRNYQIGVRFEF